LNFLPNQNFPCPRNRPTEKHVPTMKQKAS